jgi:hypothetical protein
VTTAELLAWWRHMEFHLSECGPAKYDIPNLLNLARLGAAAIAVAEAWELLDSEARDQHPCPDLALRHEYRRRAREAHAAYAALKAKVEADGGTR